MFEEDETLLMETSEEPSGLDGPVPAGLSVTTRDNEDNPAISEVLSLAFGAHPSSFATLLHPDYLESEGAFWHLGRVDDVPVSCAMSVVAGDAVGLFAVGTIPEARGRGYGSAVTSRAVTQALAAGARFGVLTARPEVQGVYERLGFSAIERWRRLVPAP